MVRGKNCVHFPLSPLVAIWLELIQDLCMLPQSCEFINVSVLLCLEDTIFLSRLLWLWPSLCFPFHIWHWMWFQVLPLLLGCPEAAGTWVAWRGFPGAGDMADCLWAPGWVLPGYVLWGSHGNREGVSFTPAGLKFWDFLGLNILYFASSMPVPLVAQSTAHLGTEGRCLMKSFQFNTGCSKVCLSAFSSCGCLY